MARKDYRFWSLNTQGFLVVKMSNNNPPEVTFTGTEDEDGTVNKFYSKFKKDVPSMVNANGYRIVFDHDKVEYALCKHKNGNITAKKTGTSDPDCTEIVFVKDKFKVESEVLTFMDASTLRKDCLTTDSNGNLSFKAFDNKDPKPDKGALFVVSEHK